MIRFEKYNPEYAEQVNNLLITLWSHLNINEREKYFKWKYIDNPIVPEILIFIAIDDNNRNVVGVSGYFLLQYAVNNQPITVASYSDAVVLPEYRGKGLFEKLTCYGMKYIEQHNYVNFYNTISNNSWPASKGFIKMGSVPLSPKSVLYKVDLLHCCNEKKTNVLIEHSNVCYNDELSTFCKKSRNKNTIGLNKTSEILKWRYSNPATKYSFVYARQNGELKSYVTYYKISAKRIYILDYEYLDR
jgi:hypothetical protein